MSILVDHEIRRMCQGDKPLLSPFCEATQGNGVVSYGLTSAGYDLRLGNKVLIFKNTFNEIMDPKRLKNDTVYMSKVFDVLDDLQFGEKVIIPPHSYILGYSLEYIRMWNDLKGVCVGKSTYARCGILVNTTPLEPAWEGHLTIEIGNISPCPVAVYVGEGIAQLEFHSLAHLPEQNYAQKGGKYQSQPDSPVPARVKS